MIEHYLFVLFHNKAVTINQVLEVLIFILTLFQLVSVGEMRCMSPPLPTILNKPIEQLSSNELRCGKLDFPCLFLFLFKF